MTVHFSHIESRQGNTFADKVIKAALVGRENVKRYSFLQRGSDERQYCSPLVNLPVCGFSRSKYAEYPEYHTSADDFNVVTAGGLEGAFDTLKAVIDGFECGGRPKVTVMCEPQLSKRGLYPTVSKVGNYSGIRERMSVLAYADGDDDVFDIATKTQVDLGTVLSEVELLREAELIELVAD